MLFLLSSRGGVYQKIITNENHDAVCKSGLGEVDVLFSEHLKGASDWKEPTGVLIFGALLQPSIMCCLTPSAFVGLKHHIITKFKAVVLAFSIPRKENGFFPSHMCFFCLRKSVRANKQETKNKQLNLPTKQTSTAVTDLWSLG